MTQFIVLAIVLIAIALVLLLRPLLGGAGGDDSRRKFAALAAARDVGVISIEEYEAKHAALFAAGATAAPAPRPVLALSLAALVPLAAFLLYWKVGAPLALDPANLVRGANVPGAAADAPASAPEMDAAISGLAERLEKEPGNVEGWLLLGRAYKATGRFSEAVDAMRHAFDLAPENVDVMTEFAEALAMATPERRIAGRSLELLQQALQRDPTNQRALWLSGAAAAQDGRYAEAAQSWETLLSQLPADADIAATLREQIAKARERAGMPPLPTVAGTPSAGTSSVAGDTVASAPPGAMPPTAVTPPMAVTPDASANSAAQEVPAATGAGPRITVVVDLAPALKAQVGPTDTLFIFARLPEGPRMPLAIQRLAASALPATIVLDDSMGMMPTLTLSSAEQVVIGARISKSGNATPQSGDFQVLSAPLAVKTQRDPVKLTISDAVP
jgi:cytochrome c-type biogenesis protein CcmH